MRASEECLQRMEALVRRMALAAEPLELHFRPNSGALESYTEAREIVAELDKGKGPSDVAIMQDILRKDYGSLDNPNNSEGPKRVAAILDSKVDYWEARLALACIAKGRELALAECAPEAMFDRVNINNLNPEVINIVGNAKGDNFMVSLRPGIVAKADRRAR